MKKKLSPLWTLAAGLVLSALACLLTLWLQAGSFRSTVGYLLRSPVLLVLNWLPMALLLTLVYCLTGNVLLGGGVTTLVWGLLSYINLVKLLARGDPFVPGDVLLLFEGIEAAGSYELTFPLGKLLLLLAVSGTLIAAGFFVRSAKPRRRWRLMGAVAAAVIFCGAVAGPYADKDLYAGLPGPDRSNVPQVFDCFGFPYAFLHNFNLYPVDRPAGYSEAEAAGFEAQYLHEKATPENAPNILMVMCEAFTDLPNAEAFTYGTEENPVAFFNSLAADENTISGRMIVSNIGAGTANTEFDVLTGMMTNRIGEGTTSAFRVVHRNTDSLPRALAEAGYQTFFTHPGHSWFYNRESVYSYLGITDHQFNDVYGSDAFKGSWISDDAFLEQLIADIEARDSEQPLFVYGVTIQNHQAYTKSKYGFLPEAVQTDLALSEAAGEYLSVYFEGLRDSDRMLRELTAYLQTREEPWLLVFFGDHQPNLGADHLSFREIGEYPADLDTAQNRLSLYAVPYVIWGNDAFQAGGGLEQPEQTTISSHYLGALTCRAAGFEGLDGYLDYLNDLREILPVSSVSGYMTADGTYLEELTGELLEMETLRWHWQYYRLKNQDLSKE